MTGRALGDFDFDVTVEQPVLLLPQIRHPESASPRPTFAKFKKYASPESLSKTAPRRKRSARSATSIWRSLKAWSRRAASGATPNGATVDHVSAKSCSKTKPKDYLKSRLLSAFRQRVR
jgi:hypothetical protein